ncbi:hypothetical protein RCL1_003612 [Eukaryota sp. TZLM3-RCL]
MIQECPLTSSLSDFGCSKQLSALCSTRNFSTCSFSVPNCAFLHNNNRCLTVDPSDFTFNDTESLGFYFDSDSKSLLSPFPIVFHQFVSTSLTSHPKLLVVLTSNSLLPRFLINNGSSWSDLPLIDSQSFQMIDAQNSDWNLHSAIVCPVNLNSAKKFCFNLFFSFSRFKTCSKLVCFSFEIVTAYHSKSSLNCSLLNFQFVPVHHSFNQSNLIVVDNVQVFYLSSGHVYAIESAESQKFQSKISLRPLFDNCSRIVENSLFIVNHSITLIYLNFDNFFVKFSAKLAPTGRIQSISQNVLAKFSNKILSCHLFSLTPCSDLIYCLDKISGKLLVFPAFTPDIILSETLVQIFDFESKLVFLSEDSFLIHGNNQLKGFRQSSLIDFFREKTVLISENSIPLDHLNFISSLLLLSIQLNYFDISTKLGLILLKFITTQKSKLVSILSRPGYSLALSLQYCRSFVPRNLLLEVLSDAVSPLFLKSLFPDINFTVACNDVDVLKNNQIDFNAKPFMLLHLVGDLKFSDELLDFYGIEFCASDNFQNSLVKISPTTMKFLILEENPSVLDPNYSGNIKPGLFELICKCFFHHYPTKLFWFVQSVHSAWETFSNQIHQSISWNYDYLFSFEMKSPFHRCLAVLAPILTRKPSIIQRRAFVQLLFSSNLKQYSAGIECLLVELDLEGIIELLPIYQLSEKEKIALIVTITETIVNRKNIEKLNEWLSFIKKFDIDDVIIPWVLESISKLELTLEDLPNISML